MRLSCPSRWAAVAVRRIAVRDRPGTVRVIAPGLRPRRRKASLRQIRPRVWRAISAVQPPSWTSFRHASEEEIRATLATYGMGYVRHSDVALWSEPPGPLPGLERPGAIKPLALHQGAEGTLERAVRSSTTLRSDNAWHSVNDEHYYVEAWGPPQSAYSYLPPVASEPRRPRCQATVGRWGQAEDPSQQFDGGHLIGAQLGGRAYAPTWFRRIETSIAATGHSSRTRWSSALRWAQIA
jgi:DNA/RNA non-specific endonuclease